MENFVKTLAEKRQVGLSQPLYRGANPIVFLEREFTLGQGIRVLILTTITAFIVLAILLPSINVDHPLGRAFDFALLAGMLTTIGYYLMPVLTIVWFSLWYRQRPPRFILSDFSLGQKIVSLLLTAFGLLYVLDNLQTLFQHIVFPHAAAHYSAAHWSHNAVVVLVLTGVLAFLIPRLLPKELKHPKMPLKSATGASKSLGGIIPFGLWIGRSTGQLSALWHQTGMAVDHEIVLTTEDAAQNMLVLGGIGAGKTTRIMQPLLVQLFDQGCGGLLFDVKGDVQKAALQISEMTHHPVTIIGPLHNQMNLLAGLTPEVAASFLKSAFLLGGTNLDSFWVDTATELCRNTLGLLSFLPNHYTLQGLYNYLFDDLTRETIQAELNPLLVTLAEKEQRLLKTYLRYHDTIFATFDEKVKSGVNATVAQALSPFNHPELIDAFCEQSQSSLNMQSVLDGTVYLVDMPLSRWGLGGKVAYTFIKLRFFNVMQSRLHHPDWNQDRPVFFMCDEYQELVSASKDGLSDLNFWDKSRSSKTIGIISAQSVSSFYAALGDHDLAHALLQNFRQKICFRTEDQATLSMMDRLAGFAKVKRKTIGQTAGNSTGSLKTPGSKHYSSTQSITETRESVLDATLFRSLTPNQAVALLSLYGHSMDDVLECLPVFL